MRKLVRHFAFLISATALAPAAHASPVTFRPDISFAAAPTTIDLGTGSYTFSNSGDFFNPVTIATAGSATVAAFGGFLGIPLAPTSFFTDPGRAPFIDAAQNYQPFAAGGTVAYSVTPAYLALAFGEADGTHYGYAYTVGARLVRYGYESVAGVGIQAPAVKTPEPGAILLFGLGLGAITVRRFRRAR